MSNKFYTYLIGWSTLDKFYYGVRYSKNSTPSDLWVNYFTSSDYVKKFREVYGEPDIIQVRKTFDSSKKARSWEDKVILRMKIVHSDKWLNRNWSGKNFYNTGFSHSDETKKKISIANTGKKFSEEHKQKLSISKSGENHPMYGKKHTTQTKSKISNSLNGENNPMFGKSASTETKQKMSIARSGANNPMFGKTGKNHPNYGLNHSEETKKKISIAKTGKKFTEEHKQKISIRVKSRPKFECPHCHKFVSKTNLLRWHNDNCKLK
ncbi:MAG: NUMOD3 domain-containing DNA-binding protein [Flavobacterium sp.]|uniref:NUMOD3 domain-containing DNA-binding protein n=1 Tax=Flavobacterium sp. TaxID=239 RepID=UPI002626E40E|nr:NUMOD3 domain-containing DNA-binding protein [Flavobacterium sp.]MDD5150007.1 NUMOD3 domain-containing DNA-binding protein [Flavobacterium sp.]